MGQEFCKGCEDCTNFKNNEGDLSYLANKPMKNLKNIYMGNPNLDNSLLNKTDFGNDTSFLTNNNVNNQNKNETLQISSLNSKRLNNDMSQNYLINGKEFQEGSEDVFKQKKEEDNTSDDDKIFNENDNTFKNNLDDDQEKIDMIQKNYYSKKITKLFKDLKEKKEKSHKIIYTEYSSINDNNYLDNNLRNGLDVNLAPEQNYLYIGSKYNYKKDGLGLEIFSNSKAKYFGRFINGIRVSLGKFNISNDNYSYYYYGEIKGLYAYGFGYSENLKESTYYEGLWVNSKKEGYGIEKYYKDNSLYEGCFSNGKKCGIGQYTWSDNSSYIGEWFEGTLNGYGIYNFPDGSIYTGSWEKNRMNGLGEFTFPEIKTYFGYFEKDKRAGFGILLWYKEKKVFLGFWKDNKQNGLGKFINNGKIRYGIWENGVQKEKIYNEENFIERLSGDETNYLYVLKSNKYEEIRSKIEGILSL